MYAAIPFYKAALDKGIKPIIGVKLDVEWEKNERDALHFSPGKIFGPPIGTTNWRDAHRSYCWRRTQRV